MQKIVKDVLRVGKEYEYDAGHYSGVTWKHLTCIDMVGVYAPLSLQPLSLPLIPSPPPSPQTKITENDLRGFYSLTEEDQKKVSARVGQKVVKMKKNKAAAPLPAAAGNKAKKARTNALSEELPKGIGLCLIEYAAVKKPSGHPA
jgi:hypothetical protein